MADEYKQAVKLLGELDVGSKAYGGIEHIPMARDYAAKFAESEGDDDAASAIRNPNTPLEQVAGGVQLANQGKKLALENLVENNFEDVLNGAKKEQLASLLTAYQPKKDNNDFYDGHVAANNLELYEVKDRIDPELAEKVVGGMVGEIAEHYKKKYAIDEENDSEAEQNMKKAKLSFFTGLYIGADGKPADDDDRVVVKFASIKKDKIKAFKEGTKTKEQMVDYILATAPDETDKKIGLLKALG